nr:trypsin-like peptidase domain-containing protein [Bradyrhizobium sp. 188]
MSGADIRSLAEKLTDAFNADEIASLVYEATGDRLYNEFVPDNMPLRATIEKLLDWRRRSRAFSRRSRAGFRKAIQRLSSKKRGASGGRPARAAAPGFQRNGRPNLPQVDVHVWLSRLEKSERQVCRVEISGNASGTGFLVGLDAVLTNWHVVEAVKNSGRLDDVACRFDYLKLVNGSRQQGVGVGLGPKGCVSYRKYSAAEKTKTPDVPEPKSDELDYALLKLARSSGARMKAGRAVDRNPNAARIGIITIIRMSRLLQFQPPRLNDLIVVAAKQPPLQKLSAAMGTLAAMDHSGSNDLANGQAALGRLAQAVRGRVAEHDLWQEIDKQIWVIEQIFGDTVDATDGVDQQLRRDCESLVGIGAPLKGILKTLGHG